MDAAVNYTCDIAASNGVPCTPEMRASLAKAYQSGLERLEDELRVQAQEPACGDTQQAKELGLLPMPCFTKFPGTEVKPAPGAVESAPAVTVRLTRVKADPEFPLTCGVTGTLRLNNDVEGYGPAEAFLWPSAQGAVPKLALGASAVTPLNFGPRQAFHLMGPKGASVEWRQLIGGAKGTLTLSTRSTQAIAPNLQGGMQTLHCSEGPVTTIQIPKSFSDMSQPWAIE